MKRAAGLVELSRRDFCAAACVALAGCIDGSHRAVQTGGLTGPDAEIIPIDASADATDAMTVAVACSGTAKDVGLASSFQLGKPVYFANGMFFVVRDSAGLYSLTALCTHQAGLCSVVGTVFRCNRHFAEFTFGGAIVSGPVTKPLPHYAMCTFPGGHVGVMTDMIVSADTRLAA
ncbi:MAG TPA: Rieske 2Fe-2S domain-containing protein [Kofleriaceae bacterium]|nr:Rieske 2Fe-2S domain-containing protein [Kofleriaceae bacterium]